jgi:hypothetical protein
VADVVTDVLDGLRQLEVPLTAEELAEALWLCQQAPRWGGLPASRAVRAAAAAMPPPGGAGSGSVNPLAPMAGSAWLEAADRAQNTRESGPVPGASPVVVAYRRDQIEETPGTPASAVPVRLADAPALPQARDLGRALRPLRYDPRRRHPAPGIDEELTAHRIAQTGLRLPVPKTTRRRRLDLDLVLDVGGSGPLWRQLAVELRAMFQVQGAFRSVRFWVLNSDSAGAPQLTRQDGTRCYPWRAVCEVPRRPLVVVLTDGASRGWQTGDAYGPLLEWAAQGTVLLIHLLPESMWRRAALRPLPVIFHPAEDGYHRGARIDVTDAQLSVIGFKRAQLRAATAIPVIGLDAGWVRAWLPLLRGGQAGIVPGYALLMPPAPASASHSREAGAGPGTPESGSADAARQPAAVERGRDDGATQARRRMDRFMLTASPNAQRLAQLLSVIDPTLPALRKIHRDLIPGGKPEEIAEVMLGGLLRWTSTTPDRALHGELALSFYNNEVKDMLSWRPGGEDEFAADVGRVARALWADPGSGASYEGFAFVPGIAGKLLSGQFPVSPRAGELPILPPYPAPTRLEVIERPADPDPMAAATAAPEAEEPPPGSAEQEADEQAVDEDESALGDDVAQIPPDAAPVRVGIFGSTQSGRTTFLAILGLLCTDWVSTPWRRGEQWRIQLASDATRRFVEDSRKSFQLRGMFPPPNYRGDTATKMSFLLERRRLRRRYVDWGWRRERLATISVTLEDWAGDDFAASKRPPDAYRYLSESNALVYFFDPTYDDRPRNQRSVDYFATVQADLGLAAAENNRMYRQYLPQHIAVCVPKLDEQSVFETARTYGCLRTDPDTGLPWVPPAQADRLFDFITYGQCSVESDLLRRLVRSAFHPSRMSFHALSSIGFWAGEGGTLDLHDVCNQVNLRAPYPGAPDWRLRSPLADIKPVHVLDPLIAVVERLLRQLGRT